MDGWAWVVYNRLCSHGGTGSAGNRPAEIHVSSTEHAISGRSCPHHTAAAARETDAAAKERGPNRMMPLVRPRPPHHSLVHSLSTAECTVVGASFNHSQQKCDSLTIVLLSYARLCCSRPSFFSFERNNLGEIEFHIAGAWLTAGQLKKAWLTFLRELRQSNCN